MLQISYVLFTVAKNKGDKLRKKLVHSLLQVRVLYAQDLLCSYIDLVHDFALAFIPSCGGTPSCDL